MSASDSGKPRILIVDDVSENIHLMLNILRGRYAIMAATSGAKALELAARNPQPDLILLDIKMPEMDGYEVLRRLKGNPETADIPVIFVTALSESADEARGLKMGAADYITKPVNPDLLLVRVMTQLELRRYVRMLRPHREAQHPGEGQASILVVDDMPENIHGLVDALSDEYRMIVANSGQKAVEIVLGPTPPDIILLDVLMPEMDGYEVCSRIKTGVGARAHIPVLFLTVLDSSVDKVKGFDIGGADFITKPFDINEVRARIRTHLELSRYRNHLEAVVEKTTVELEQKKLDLTKLTLVIEQSPDSIMITDVKERIEYVNDAFVAHSGYSREEVIGNTPRMLQSGKTPRTIYDSLRGALNAGQPWRGEFINRCKDGREVVEHATIVPIRQFDGYVSHYACIEHDLTNQKMAEATIHHLTNFDYLTGLPNKTLLSEHLEHALFALRHQQKLGGLIMLNIDRFKDMNDAGGRDLADAFLIAFGGRLATLVNEGDMLARLSGDEYAILMPDLGDQHEKAAQSVISMVGKIREDLRTPFLFGADEVFVTVSLGVALFPGDGIESEQDIMRHAGVALHRAKESGGSQVSFFDNAMTASAENRFRMERELRLAISGNEFRLFLQPQVDAQGCRVGAEALIRWKHPERGLVLPGVFIPIAEESDLIVEIGIWVMTEACRLIAQEESRGVSLDLSVNISPRHFHQPEFVPWIKGLVAAIGVEASRLTLEITENLVIRDISDVVTKMTELADLGFHFSIDDFGTGYSSLAYLKRLPIHEIKIDKTFIRDLTVDSDDAALVETILAVAKHMRLKVVAEGVETEEQAAHLNALGPVIHQGYLFGRPEAASIWLERWG